jgi:nicotinate-nucleotide adenylyltransferase
VRGADVSAPLLFLKRHRFRFTCRPRYSTRVRFLDRTPTVQSSLGVFPGAFNPVTVAHMELARAALSEVEHALFVLPEEFPHKTYVGAPFAERLEMLAVALRDEPGMSVASCPSGLFRDIAAECRADFGTGVRLWFLCGADAAERVANWPYGGPGAFDEMMREFGLLVASRNAEFTTRRQDGSIRRLRMAPNLEAVSSSEVRKRIALGEPWDTLVPPAIRDIVASIYSRSY